jgi:hypothetical protein
MPLIRLHLLDIRYTTTVQGEQSLTYCLEKIFEFIAIGEEVWRHEESGQWKNAGKWKNETVAEQKARELLCAADIDESMYWQLIESDRLRSMFDEDKRGSSSSGCVRSANCWVRVRVKVRVRVRVRVTVTVTVRVTVIRVRVRVTVTVTVRITVRVRVTVTVTVTVTVRVRVRVRVRVSVVCSHSNAIFEI